MNQLRFLHMFDSRFDNRPPCTDMEVSWNKGIPSNPAFRRSYFFWSAICPIMWVGSNKGGILKARYWNIDNFLGNLIASKPKNSKSLQRSSKTKGLPIGLGDQSRLLDTGPWRALYRPWLVEGTWWCLRVASAIRTSDALASGSFSWAGAVLCRPRRKVSDARSPG